MTVGWTELGDRCWVRRYDELDLNVGLVVGGGGALVIDTRATTAEAEELLRHIREVTDQPVRWVVNTHSHYDHVNGNSVFTQATAYAHENTIAAIDLKAESFAVAKVIDLGDRRVELLYLGNGHTAGDAVAVVPDVNVFFLGDLVEESQPPQYGDDSFPLEWPDTLERIIGTMPKGAVVVPGHGAVVDAAFATAQRDELGQVANVISDLHHAGTSLEKALEHKDGWPWDGADLQDAIKRAYEVLGPPRRPTIPLLGPS